MTTQPKPKAPKYRVLLGINWPDGKGGERRAEPGALLSASDLKTAKGGIQGFVNLGALEEVGGED